ncbi:MAG TPA: serine/threonine protein kinase [Thermoanaerobaculia bacterium]|nr:serine/threonine protein kinase [Thermoanaerobaculia bacterium]
MKLSRIRFGLLPRVALALAAVGLLPLLMVSLGLVRLNREALYDQVLRTHIVAAHTAADRIDAILDTRAALARGTAGSPELADPGSPEAQAFLRRNLEQWGELGALAVAVVNPAGELVFRAQVRGEGERAEAALRRGVTGLYVPWQGAPVLRFAAPLALGAGSLVLICGGAPVAEAARPQELDREAQLVVIDRSVPGGRIVAGSLTSLAALPRSLTAVALSGKVVGASRHTVGGQTILAAYAPLAGADWVVVSLQPTASAEAVATKLRWRTAGAVGAALLLIAALSAVAWAFLVRPIRALAAAQRGLAGMGAGGGRAGGDEIADLRQTFDLLQRSLAARSTLDNVFLGRYQVIEALGAGAMGTVFRGWDPRLRRPVALKTIKLAGVLEEERRKDLLATLTREAVTVARLNHPNVVAVYDLEDAPEAAFIAMELVDGMTLETLLGRRHKLTPDEVIPLGMAIARGLAAAHAQGIVHRDVKPANVLLGADGSIKVSDFGIAGLLAASAEDADTIFGTPGYLPPESLRGGMHGKAGDLLSLGVVLYICLTGAMPFRGTEVGDILRNTLFGQVRPLRRQVPDIPTELESLVDHLLEREVDRRPSSAEAVAAELESLVLARGLRWRFDPGTAAAGRGYATEPVKAQWVPTTRLDVLEHRAARSS